MRSMSKTTLNRTMERRHFLLNDTKIWIKQAPHMTFHLIKGRETKKLIEFSLKMRRCWKDSKIGLPTTMYRAGRRKENLTLSELSRFVCIHPASVPAREQHIERRKMHWAPRTYTYSIWRNGMLLLAQISRCLRCTICPCATCKMSLLILVPSRDTHTMPR